MTAPARRVVYTAVMGGYEELQDQPIAASSAVAFVCLTDQESLRSDDWEVRLVEPLLPADRIRSARALKITGHPSLSEYTETLWIDNRVRLAADPDELLDEWLAVEEVAVPRHSFRADVVTEFQAVLDHGLDDSSRLYEQLSHYSSLSPDLLRHPVPWTGMLARRRSPGVDAAMERWLLHVLRYSRRDQLSFVQAMQEAGLTWSSVDLPNTGSAVHEWRHAVGRSSRPVAFQVADSLQPPVAALGELRLSFEQTVADLSSAVQSRELAIEALESAVKSGHRDRDRMAQENAELAALRARDLDTLEKLRRQVRQVRRSKRRIERELARASAPWRPWRRAAPTATRSDS